MPTAHFTSLDDAEIVDVEFFTLSGENRRRRLLVDSGFTGGSSLVLSDAEPELIWAAMEPAPASGALQGDQTRAWVKCRIPELGFQATLIAIIADLAPLSLPIGVQGMAGLSFLRRFSHWGAEQSTEGWRFYLSVNSSPGFCEVAAPSRSENSSPKRAPRRRVR